MHSVLFLLLLTAEPGKDLFERRCGGCHALDHSKEGPPLRGVFGRQAGKVPGYTYSAAVTSSRVRWDEASLDKWLTDPDSLIPDSDMAFRLNSQMERTAIIEYLKHAK